MLIVRPLSIVEDGVERLEVVRVRIEPGVDVLGLDRNDAAIVAGCGRFQQALICDCGEAQKVGLLRAA